MCVCMYVNVMREIYIYLYKIHIINYISNKIIKSKAG